ncbi:hypothetical protein AYO47_05255 [Planctomyces sp. SCGC AG-212-M04]|nr:hypothetical protein AYO47_05255 [Planctomyces sp. SCGC AG-212-M04]
MLKQSGAREYRIILKSLMDADGHVFAPQFTAVVVARDPEDAVTEAEKLAEVLEGRFRVLDI